MTIANSGDLQVATDLSGARQQSTPVTVTGGNAAAPLPVAGRVSRASASFTRPSDTTAYAIGDLVANSVTAGSVVVGSIDLGVSQAIIRAAKMATTNVAGAGAIKRVHLFSALPTTAGGDNAAFNVAGAANHIGYIDVMLDRNFSDGATGRGAPSADIHVNLGAGTTVWFLIEAQSAFTPASGSTITATLEFLPA